MFEIPLLVRSLCKEAATVLNIALGAVELGMRTRFNQYLIISKPDSALPNALLILCWLLAICTFVPDRVAKLTANAENTSTNIMDRISAAPRLLAERSLLYGCVGRRNIIQLSVGVEAGWNFGRVQSVKIQRGVSFHYGRSI